MSDAQTQTSSRGAVSDQIEGWLEGEGDKTLGSLIELFEKKSFAILFVFLLGVTLPALGVVLLSLGVLLEDALVVVVALVVGATGVLLELVLGGAALRGLEDLF